MVMPEGFILTWEREAHAYHLSMMRMEKKLEDDVENTSARSARVGRPPFRILL